MNRGEFLEAFYVDAGLTDQDDRGALAPEGDVDSWVNQARLRLGPVARRSAPISWSAGAVTVELPTGCASVSRIALDPGCSLPAYDEWGGVLALRQAATSGGTGTVFYTTYFDQPAAATSSGEAAQDQACLAYIEYALSRFFRKMAGSRVDFRRYSTVTGQSGVEAGDLRDLSDDHLGEFESIRGDLALQPSSSYFGE